MTSLLRNCLKNFQWLFLAVCRPGVISSIDQLTIDRRIKIEETGNIGLYYERSKYSYWNVPKFELGRLEAGKKALEKELTELTGMPDQFDAVFLRGKKVIMEIIKLIIRERPDDSWLKIAKSDYDSEVVKLEALKEKKKPSTREWLIVLRKNGYILDKKDSYKDFILAMQMLEKEAIKQKQMTHGKR